MSISLSLLNRYVMSPSSESKTGVFRLSRKGYEFMSVNRSYMLRGWTASAVHFAQRTPSEKGNTWSRLPVNSNRMTARVTDSRVTPHIVAPAATNAYTPGVTHDSMFPESWQCDHKKKFGSF